jgi:hypothetical protein
MPFGIFVSFEKNLGSMLLCITSDDEMTKKKGFTFANFVIFKYIYRIQIVQNVVQLSSKGRFKSTTPIFNSMKIWKQLG